MSLDRTVRIAAALVIALIPAGVRAQTADDLARSAEFFDALVEQTPGEIARLRDEVRQAYAREIADATRDATAIAQSRQVSERTPSLSTANASTAVEKAQAAIKTDITGADAGVSINPLALVGQSTTPLQFIFTAAALKDGVTRFQQGITWQHERIARLDLPSCHALTGNEMQAFKDAARLLKPSYLKACTLAAALDTSNMDKTATRQVEAAEAACGLSDDQPAPRSLGDASGTLARMLTIVDETSQDAAVRFGVQAINDELTKFQQPPVDCVTEAAIDEAIVRASWTTPRLRLGLSLRADLFPRKFGFHPDINEPRDLRRSDSEVRFEFSHGRERLEITGGIGYGASRTSASAPLVTYWSPALSIAWTVGSLGDKPLYDRAGRLNVVNRALPPRLVLGVDASLQYASAPPPGQVVKIQKVNVTPYADFRFTDKLTVRVGIPIAAGLQTRKGDMTAGGADKTDRQWTIPAFVATVIKL